MSGWTHIYVTDTPVRMYPIFYATDIANGTFEHNSVDSRLDSVWDLRASPFSTVGKVAGKREARDRGAVRDGNERKCTTKKSIRITKFCIHMNESTSAKANKLNSHHAQHQTCTIQQKDVWDEIFHCLLGCSLYLFWCINWVVLLLFSGGGWSVRLASDAEKHM